MKSGKEAARFAKKLFTATMVDGTVNVETVRTIVKKLVEEKPRGYLALINAYWKLIRLEIEKTSALVESAEELEADVQASVIADLKKKYGDQVEAEFALDAELIGGMKIQVGSDVWDGSVKNRLERLAENFN